MATPTVRFGPHFRCHSGMVRRTRPQMCDAHRGISRFPDVHRTSEVRALRAPERRVENQSSQPPLPPFKTLQILKTLALRSEEHTSELQSQSNLVCRLLLEKKKEIQRGLWESRDVAPYHSLQRSS